MQISGGHGWKMQFVLAAILWFATVAAAPAEAFPERSDLYVTALASAIGSAAENRIRTSLERLRADTGVELTVLTIATRSVYDPSASIETFATGLFNEWGIGDDNLHNGILILVVTDDREMRVELGAGHAVRYDPVAQEIIERFFLPRFRKGDYSGGIEAGVHEVVIRIAHRLEGEQL